MRFNALIPELTVNDAQRSLAFYLALGFKEEYGRDAPPFFFLSLQGSQLMIEERHRGWETARLTLPYGRGINFQMTVKNIAPLLRALRNMRHPLFLPPAEHWYRANKQEAGCREFLVQDPDGYLLRFSEDLGWRTTQTRGRR